MAVTNQKWDGSASRWPDTASFCDCCALNANTGDRKNWTQDNCKLPYREPNGDINSNALSAAAAALSGSRGGVSASPAQKKSAAKKILAGYRQAQMDPPESLKNLAQ